MRHTVKQVVAVTALAFCSRAVVADNRYFNQDQMEDVLYGNGVSLSISTPYQRDSDDRDHSGYLPYNLDDTNPSGSFVAYVRSGDDRDNSEDQLYGSLGSEQPGGFAPAIASQ